VWGIRASEMIWAQALFVVGLAPFFIFPRLDRDWIFLILEEIMR